MQNLKILGLILVIASNVFAQEAETRVKSTIEEVIVYQKNARILRKAKANIPAGKSELVLEQLSQKILINSIQVKLSNKNVALVSAVPRVNYLKQTEASERYQTISDSIQLFERALRALALDQKVVQITKKTLLDNNPLGSSKKEGFTVEEVKKVMEFKRKELAALEKELLELDYKRRELQQKEAMLRRQLNVLSNARSKPSGEIVLQLQAAAQVATDIEVVYVVTNAGWRPLYDLKSEGVGKPLELVYKAHVYQSTGFDWEQIKLSLSSSDPSLSHDRPILNPLKLNLLASHYKAKKKKGNTYIQYQGSGNVVLDEEFIRNNPQRNLTGIIASGATVNSVDKGEAINSNGSRSASNDIYINGAPIIGVQEVVVDDIILNFDNEDLLANGNHTIEFDLALLQDIPSDGEKHIVEVKRHEMEVNYEYHIVPKIDKGAFLLAKITNYGQYNLLSGNANIFFEGVYLGQSYLNSKSTMDTLLLSLGRDEKISVKREKLKSVRKENGSLTKERLGFEISVRNNKSESIDINVLDQIPVSKNKELEIKLLESTGAIFYAPYGSLRWRKTLKPNLTEKLKFEYEVKYPKGRGVSKVNG
ncbi:DUF4139 domain-containing protein [Aureispira anguillae]|uniref:Mucoidy inhibitor MuiA family protein n=1 Tax=Aureispira anguillae TaxID=2864201 RepID=A0A916DP84_9BACT|nr:mucoidy inhibitor MuiA family protein [Aureispira anguillae]BDS10374.1 mucoidy inhibitor MuiA family protein [Aureispira anguillae]